MRDAHCQRPQHQHTLQDRAALEKKHAEELARFDREARILAHLPATIEPAHVYAHADHTSVTYEVTTVADAVWVFAAYNGTTPGIAIEYAEHWKDGCLSVLPAALNTYATRERAVLENTSAAELRFDGYGGNRHDGPDYNTVELRFFATLPTGAHLHVGVRIGQRWAFSGGACVRGGRRAEGGGGPLRVMITGLGEDFYTKWASELPAYQVSFYWCDVETFYAWADTWLAA
jgi:hypothetical protein